MSRDRFGQWGEEVPDATFAAALAAIGAAAAVNQDILHATPMEVSQWWLHYLDTHPEDTPLPWRNPVEVAGWDQVEASDWAEIYQDGRGRRMRYRWAVDPELAGIDERWLGQTLVSQGAYGDGVFFAVEAPTESARAWRYPLRVGLLPSAGGAVIRHGLDNAASAEPWTRTLIQPVMLGPSVVSADLVVADLGHARRPVRRP